MVTLESGRRVEVIDMGFDDGEPREWRFRYRTYIAMNRPGVVACEVATLWRDLQREADRAGAIQAFIEAENFSSRAISAGGRALVVSHESNGALLRKSEGGEWKRVGGPVCGE